MSIWGMIKSNTFRFQIRKDVHFLNKLFNVLYSLLGCLTLFISIYFFQHATQNKMTLIFAIFYLFLSLCLFIYLFFSNKSDKEFEEKIASPKKEKTVKATRSAAHITKKVKKKIPVPKAISPFFMKKEVAVSQMKKSEDSVKETNFYELSTPLIFTSFVERVSCNESNYYKGIDKIIKDTCQYFNINYATVASHDIREIFNMHIQLRSFYTTSDVRLHKKTNQKTNKIEIEVLLFEKPIGFLAADKVKFLLPYLSKETTPTVKASLIGGPYKVYDAKKQIMNTEYKDFQVQVIVEIHRAPKAIFAK